MTRMRRSDHIAFDFRIGFGSQPRAASGIIASIKLLLKHLSQRFGRGQILPLRALKPRQRAQNMRRIRPLPPRSV